MPASRSFPQGRRRLGLEAAAHAVFVQDFAGRVLTFGGEAAITYADIFSSRRRAGLPIATTDLLIAAITLSQDAVLVTRDTRGFEHCGLTIINPWQAS